MGWNVPDDWGYYYTKCDSCGNTYHESEGSCDCNGGVADSEGPHLEDSERPHLEDSNYELCTDGNWEKLISVKVHTARRDHTKRSINKGQRYRLWTTRVISDEDGTSWIRKAYSVFK